MTGRQKAIAFFITLGSCLTAAAITLNVGWIIIHWRRVAPLVLGVIFFALIIAGLIIYTIFIVREIRRNEQHDSFINAVTHELKTPIASLRLYLETLASREVTPEQRHKFYKVMIGDTERLLYTVDQVLKAGMAGHKQRKRARAPVELNQLLRETSEWTRLRHHLGEDAVHFAGTDVAGGAAGGAVHVLGDAEDLRTAVTNLLDNAVKYSSEDVRVRVALERPTPEKVRVRVSDNGMGIPRKQLKMIFQRFYRVPSRMVRQVKGTGLGLFIVRTIAKQHGGRVFAESEGEGKGATFTLELPILELPDLELPVEELPIAEERTPPSPGS